MAHQGFDVDHLLIDRGYTRRRCVGYQTLINEVLAKHARSSAA
jgi:hypothetical protein